MKKMSDEELIITLKAARNGFLAVLFAIAAWMFVNIANGERPTIQMCFLAGGLTVFWISKSIIQGEIRNKDGKGNESDKIL